MKKTITLMLCIVLFATFSKATNFYVDPVGGSNSNSGQSWTLAVADITTAISKASSGAFLTTVDNIFVKQGTINLPSATVFTSIDNIYGSCFGNEDSPEKRPMADLDGNGIIEPWEFQYTTTLTSSLTATSATVTQALKVALTNSTFNGFTITHNAISTLYLSKNIWCSDATSTFENNIVKNCNNTSAWTAGSQLGLIIQAAGTVKNCLFEKNQVYVTSAMNASAFVPIMSLTTGAKLLNCVFRNNKATVDYSASTSANSGAGLKGMIINAESAASGITTIANTLIYNNESIYMPGTSGTLTTIANGATVSLSGTTGAANTDSIINCTIANNKTTKMGTGGLSAQKTSSLVNFVVNNVLWNNQNDGVVKNITVNSSLSTGIVANNVYNAGSTGLTPTTTYVVNNLSNLDNSNTTATYGPQFKNNTTLIGSNRIAGSSDSIAIAQADWRLNPGTYLIAKGIPTSRLTDKAGVAFATTPSVGAYEYILTTPTISWSQNLTALKVGDANVTLTATSDAGTYGSPITYTSDNTNAVTVAGNVLSVVAAGTGNVTAKQAANAYFNAAVNVIQAVVVTDTSTGLNTLNENKELVINGNNIISSVAGTLQIFTFSGKLIVNTIVNNGKTLTLPTGSYIIRLTTEKAVVLKKIIL